MKTLGKTPTEFSNRRGNGILGGSKPQTKSAWGGGCSANVAPSSSLRFWILLLVVLAMAGSCFELMSKLSGPRKAKRTQTVTLPDVGVERHGVFFAEDMFENKTTESGGGGLEAALGGGAEELDAKEDAETEGNEEAEDAEENEDLDSESDEWDGAVRKGRKLLNPEDPERSWLPPFKEFHELKELNPESREFKEAFRVVQDTNLRTRMDMLDANDLGMLGEPVQYLFRFLRTLSREQLEQWRKEYLRRINEKEIGEPFAGNVMRNPDLYRGAPHAFRGVLVDKYYTYSWKLYEGEKHGGVPCANLFFCRASGAGQHHYGVLVPSEGRGLIGSREEKDKPDRVEWTGLFLTVWPYKSRMDDKWMTIPVYVAMELRKVPAATEENRLWMYVLAALGFLVVVALVVYLKRDARRAEELAKILREQRSKMKRERRNEARAASLKEIESEDKNDSAPSPET